MAEKTENTAVLRASAAVRLPMGRVPGDASAKVAELVYGKSSSSLNKPATPEQPPPAQPPQEARTSTPPGTAVGSGIKAVRGLSGGGGGGFSATAGGIDDAAWQRCSAAVER